MSDHEIILAIQDLIDGVNWDHDTLPEIAKLLSENGYQIRAVKESQE